MTFTTDTSGCERLMSLMNDLQTEFQTRMEHDCLRSQMWGSTEMHRLTYSEWQAASPRMVRRWNKNGRHQRDDDASSAAVEVAEAEARGRCAPDNAGTAGQSCKTDSYADLCASLRVRLPSPGRATMRVPKGSLRRTNPSDRVCFSALAKSGRAARRGNPAAGQRHRVQPENPSR